MAGGGCGTCTPADNPTFLVYTDTSTYTIGDPSRVMGGYWTQASFPSVPCPSPQLIYWEYYQGGAWRNITSVSVGVQKPTGTNPQSANASTIYYRNIIFVAVGTWSLRMRMNCGAGFYSAPVDQVVVAASVGSPKVLTTQAGIL